MAIRSFDPRRLDIEAFASEAGSLEGAWPLDGFARLATSTLPGPPDGPPREVTWHARAQCLPARGSAAETWLHLGAHADVVLECQRCLAPMKLAIDVDRRFRFVAGEDAAAQLDAEDEEHDVLATSRALDLHDLLEDELLLALPIVPRHEVCPTPLVAEDVPGDASPNPFAVLANWKRGDAGG